MDDMRVPASIANQPPPTKPNNDLYWRAEWGYYLLDYACWKAMKADCLLLGVKED